MAEYLSVSKPVGTEHVALGNRDKVEYTWDNKPPIRLLNTALFHTTSTPIPPYFWGSDSPSRKDEPAFPAHRGYLEAGEIIGNGSAERLYELTEQAIDYVSRAFGALNQAETDSDAPKLLARLRLSDDLEEWRKAQIAQGRVLPSKGYGLKPVSLEIRGLFGADQWPAPMITHGALFGCGILNMFLGAYDAPTLLSNYLNDLAFYFEHGYHRVFPQFEGLFRRSFTDKHALLTPGGLERRAAAEIGLRYIKEKVKLEEKHKGKIGNQSAAMDRHTAQVVSLFESSLLGVGGEAIGRGYDAAGVMADLVFSSPATDVVDVGRDIHNSEVMNSFLNTKGFTDTGVVTEEKLSRVYDAYAHTGARSFVDRWAEPTARIDAILYIWHILNDRHNFLRLAVLGYPKARKAGSGQQREADFDEAFDQNLRTTGFNRPLEAACDGGDPCNAVRRAAGEQGEHGAGSVVLNVWRRLVTGPMEYVAAGKVDAGREDELVDQLGLALARACSQGYRLELA